MKMMLTAALLSLAVSALATPMLDKCLPFAPKVCALTDASSHDDFLSCFKPVHLDLLKPAEASCAEELAHARVHKACDATDLPTLCADVKPGDNRVMSCLRKNKKKLGGDCRKALRSYDGLQLMNGGDAQKDGDTKKDGHKKGKKGSVAAVRC